MRISMKAITIATLLLASSLSAAAQSTVPNIPVRPGREPLPEGSINLQSSLTLSIPFDDAKPLDAQIEAAQRMVYGLAGKQCDIVLSTIATECRVTNLSNTVNNQRYQQNNTQFGATVQITMTVKLK